LFITCILEPDGAPQNVQGQNSSSTSILVAWDEVPADQQNGIITGYTITYHSQTENDNGAVQVNGSVRQTELTNLKEYVNYNITFFASTVKGEGPASVPIVVRTDQDSKYFFSKHYFWVFFSVILYFNLFQELQSIEVSFKSKHLFSYR